MKSRRGRHRASQIDDRLYGVLKDSNVELNDEDLGDWTSVQYCSEKLGKRHDNPFFLACGLVKPHLPLVVPRKYHDQFPEGEIVLSPVKWDDIDDLPDIAVELLEREIIHERIVKTGRWKLAVSNYLACMLYFDTMLGKLLRALEVGPNSHDTLVVFWSDHGLHFGEKQRWKKHTLWEEATHVPMVWSAPWTKKKGICDRVVETLGVFPTLCGMTGLSTPGDLDGRSFASLVEDPQAKWEYPAFTTWGRGSHAVRYQQWRYIRYRDGSEELYDQSRDPYEWTNLADSKEHEGTKRSLYETLRESIMEKETAKTRQLLATRRIEESGLLSWNGDDQDD